MRSSPTTVAEILEILANRGSDRYGAENLNQPAHALQGAWLAERAGADEDLITAGCFTTWGIHKYGDDAAKQGINARHIGSK